MFRSGFHFGDPSLPLFTMYGEEMPFFLGIGVVLVVAEALLALKKDARLGLVLPGAFFAWAAAKCVVRMIRWSPVMSDLWFALWVENIPTAILLVAYAICRIWRRIHSLRQADKSRLPDKTRIEDL